MASRMLYDPNSFHDDDDLESEVTQEDRAPTDDELEHFRQQVGEWMKLDDSIRKLTVAVRERKIHQQAIGIKIQEFMTRFKYDNLNTQMGRIKHNVRQVKQPLRLSDIREKILALQGLTGEELVAKIFDEERPTSEKRSLRRVIPKVSLSLDI